MSKTITLNRKRVPVEIHPDSGEEYVRVPDPSGGIVSLSVVGAKKFKSASSQYPLAPPIEKVVREELMDENEPFFLLPLSEQKRRIHRVLTMMLLCERAMLQHDAQPIMEEI